MASTYRKSHGIKRLDQGIMCRKFTSAYDGKFLKYVSSSCASGDLIKNISGVLSSKKVKISDPSDTETVSQDTFNKRVSDFFIRLMIPLHYIENQHFRKMFTALNIDKVGLHLMDKAHLESHINDMYTKVRTGLRIQLGLIKDVCIVTNVLYGRRECLVTTCHWIDSDLKRKSCILACRPYRGHSSVMWGINKLNFERIAGLQDLKTLVAEVSEERTVPKISSDTAEGPSEGDQLHVEDGIVVVSNFMTENNKISVQLCPAYQLDHFTSETLSAEVIEKCYLLWDAADEPTFEKVIQNLIGHSLTRPYNDYYWEWYESLKQILEMRDKSASLKIDLKLDDFLQENDFILIKEFIKCFKPIAEAAKLLENDSDLFYGITLPCLLSLRKKLIILSNENYDFIHYKHLPSKYLKLVEDMFVDYFNLSTDVAVNAAIAAISHPRFKDRWFSMIDAEHREKIKAVFEQAIADEISSTGEVPTVDAECYVNESFFEFEMDFSEIQLTCQKHTPQVLMNLYLADKESDLATLHKYKAIKNVFVKYNTPLSIKSIVYKSFLYETIAKIGSATQSEELLEKMLVLNVV